jgi:hypothetical protein
MTEDDKSPAGFSLRRWSTRKRAAVGAAGATPTATPTPAATSVTATPIATTTVVPPVDGGEGRAPPTVLPPIETLTPSSDFTPFMRPDVDPALRQAALHKLFADPQFNVMDGLDVYIDDYSKPDPMPPEWYDQLNMMKRLGSFLEEPEKPAAGPSEELQKQMPEQAFQPDAESISSGTKGDNAANNGVTESGIAGGKLPRNEA